MRRVLVIGPGGAGKSTLARRIAAATRLPLIHLDRLYWRSGWVPTPNAEWDEVVAELVARDAWVIDGNYGRTLPARLAASDTVVFLDVPARRCLWRLVKRRWEHARRPRVDLPTGCPERLTWEFVWWVWGFRTRRRPEILRQLAAAADRASIFILRSNADVEQFVSQLPRPAADAPVDRR